MLGLEDFERFSFVMPVLERDSEHDCLLFLGCWVREFSEARARAFRKLMDSSKRKAENKDEQVREDSGRSDERVLC